MAKIKIKKNKETELEKVTQEILNCKYCLDSAKGLLVPGEGPVNAKFFLIGEAPGKNEILTGRPFNGRAGKVLDSIISEAGLIREEVYIGSAVKYLPKNYITPKPSDIEHGRTHLFRQLDVIQPEVIVLMGSIAVQAVLQEKRSIAKDHGKFVQKDGLTYFIGYHPAAPLYSPALREVIIRDYKKLKKYL